MQTPKPVRRRLRRTPFALLGVAMAGSVGQQAAAQEATGSRGFTLTPSFSAQESFLQNSARIDGDNGHDAITTLSPGLRLSSRSGGIRGSLDYTANLIYRAGRAASEGFDHENDLSAAFQVEAVPNRVFVDISASVSQQAISAFGEQSVDGSFQSNANRTEVSTLNVSPYVRGAFGSFANYEVRLGASGTHSGSAAAADAKSTNASASLTSPRSGAILGWALSASQQRSEFTGATSTAGANDDSRINATVTLTPVPEVRLSASGGRESADPGAQADRRQTNTYGGGLLWTPSLRTSLSVDADERYFGRTNRIAFLHRTPRSIWTYSATRDVTTTSDGTVNTQPMTLHDLLYAQVPSNITDPAEREQVVQTELAGQPGNQLVSLAFLTNGLSIQNRQDLSFAWLGQRTTFNLQAFTTAVSQITTIGDADPVTGEATRQHGYSSSLSYRLTPETSVTLGGSRTMTFSTSTQPGNDLKSAFISLSSQIGARTSVQAGLSHAVFSSTTDPYRQTSASASVSLRF